MKYFLAILAVIWLADGVALVIAPRTVVTLLREGLTTSPWLLRWEAVAAALGAALLVASPGLWLGVLWGLTGAVMILKGLFLAVGPPALRQRVLEWWLNRDEVDYRLWGIGLCTLAALMFRALAGMPVRE